jgi:hypothetical protein
MKSLAFDMVSLVATLCRLEVQSTVGTCQIAAHSKNVHRSRCGSHITRKCLTGLVAASLSCVSIASLSAFEGVRTVWVSASQWPNARTQAEFARDAVRLYGAENGSDEEKALAIYYYSLRVMGHGGNPRQGPYGKETVVWDHWMVFHSYTKALCEYWAWFIIDLWKAYHGNWSFDPAKGVARKISLDATREVPPVPGAGNEGRISVLKRRHGLDRCRYHGEDGMHRWVGLAVIANNLVSTATFSRARAAA